MARKAHERGVFLYKYGLKAGDSFIRFENGLDRIADLTLLPGCNDGIKQVELADSWEQFKVNFMVHEPDVKTGETMCIAGDREELGNWAPQAMNIEEKNRNWMKGKFGMAVKRYHKIQKEFKN